MNGEAAIQREGRGMTVRGRGREDMGKAAGVTAPTKGRDRQEGGNICDQHSKGNTREKRLYRGK